MENQPWWLKEIADLAETLSGQVTPANEVVTGWWLKIATALELFSGTGTEANADLTGYMRRACLAAEALGGSEVDHNENVMGYLRCIAESLELYAGEATEGSYVSRIYEALLKSTSLEPETSALLSRMDVQPTTAQIQALNKAIGSLKSAGIFDKLDGFFALGLHTQQASCLDWTLNARDLIAFNSPAWTAYQGFTGDATAAYLTNGWAPFSDPNAKAKLSDIHIGVWCNTTTANNAHNDMGLQNANNVAGRTYITARATSAGMNIRLNRSDSMSTTSVTTAVGHSLGCRSATGASMYKDGISVFSVSNAATEMSEGTLQVLRAITDNYTAREVRFAHIGGFLTAAEAAALYSILTTFNSEYVA